MCSPLTAKMCMVPLARKASSISCGVFSRVPSTIVRTVAAMSGESSRSAETARPIQSRLRKAAAMTGFP